MAKATKTHAEQTKRQAKRGNPNKKEGTQVKVSLGDLIAAAFDTVGTEVQKVARVLSSRDMTRVTGRKIVFV